MIEILSIFEPSADGSEYIEHPARVLNQPFPMLDESKIEITAASFRSRQLGFLVRMEKEATSYLLQVLPQKFTDGRIIHLKRFEVCLPNNPTKLVFHLYENRSEWTNEMHRLDQEVLDFVCLEVGQSREDKMKQIDDLFKGVSVVALKVATNA